jgi:hypothetical protein
MVRAESSALQTYRYPTLANAQRARIDGLAM